MEYVDEHVTDYPSRLNAETSDIGGETVFDANSDPFADLNSTGGFIEDPTKHKHHKDLGKLSSLKNSIDYLKMSSSHSNGSTGINLHSKRRHGGKSLPPE